MSSSLCLLLRTPSPAVLLLLPVVLVLMPTTASSSLPASVFHDGIIVIGMDEMFVDYCHTRRPDLSVVLNPELRISNDSDSYYDVTTNTYRPCVERHTDWLYLLYDDYFNSRASVANPYFTLPYFGDLQVLNRDYSPLFITGAFLWWCPRNDTLLEFVMREERSGRQWVHRVLVGNEENPRTRIERYETPFCVCPSRWYHFKVRGTSARLERDVPGKYWTEWISYGWFLTRDRLRTNNERCETGDRQCS